MRLLLLALLYLSPFVVRADDPGPTDVVRDPDVNEPEKVVDPTDVAPIAATIAETPEPTHAPNAFDQTFPPTAAPVLQQDAEVCNICGCSDCSILTTVGNIDFYYPPHERNYRFTCKQLQDKMYNSIAISQDFCKQVIPPLAWEPCRCIDSEGNLLLEHPPPGFELIDRPTPAPFRTHPPSEHRHIPPPPGVNDKFWETRPWFWHGVAALLLALICCCCACCYTCTKRRDRRRRRRRKEAHNLDQYHDNEGVMLEENDEDPYRGGGYSDHPDDDDLPADQYAEPSAELPVYQGEADFNVDEENDHQLT